MILKGFGFVGILCRCKGQFPLYSSILSSMHSLIVTTEIYVLNSGYIFVYKTVGFVVQIAKEAFQDFACGEMANRRSLSSENIIQ
jgi:hypothetical protein